MSKLNKKQRSPGLYKKNIYLRKPPLWLDLALLPKDMNAALWMDLLKSSSCGFNNSNDQTFNRIRG